MTATAIFAVETAPIIALQPPVTNAVVAEMSLSTEVQSMSKEDLKQVILSIFRENNAEFKQLFDELEIPVAKKRKRKSYHLMVKSR